MSMPAELIRHLPLAKEVVLSARQEMVMRLDGYCEASRELFEEVGGRYCSRDSFHVLKRINKVVPYPHDGHCEVFMLDPIPV